MNSTISSTYEVFPGVCKYFLKYSILYHECCIGIALNMEYSYPELLLILVYT